MESYFLNLFFFIYLFYFYFIFKFHIYISIISVPLKLLRQNGQFKFLLKTWFKHSLQKTCPLYVNILNILNIKKFFF